MMVFVAAGLFGFLGFAAGGLTMAVLAVRNCRTEPIDFVFEWDGPNATFIETEDLGGNGVGVGEFVDSEGRFSRLRVDVPAYEVRR